VKKTYGILLVVIILVIGFYTINNKKVAPSAQTLKIGAVLSLTGYGAADSENIKNGLELAKEDLAKKGLGVDIEYQDDATDPKQTVSAIQFLAAKHPDALVGPIWSYLVDSAVSSIDQNKIVTYSPSVTSEYIQKTSRYLFQGSTKNTQAIPVIKKEFATRNIKNVAIVTTQGGWGESILSVFTAAAKESGVNIVLQETTQFGSEPNTLRTIVTKVKASKADAILWTGSKEGAVAMVKFLQDQNINLTVTGTTGLNDAINDKLISAGNLKLVVISPKVSNAYIEKYKARYNKVPGYYSDMAYDALMILAEAKTHSNNQDEMRTYIEKINYSGFVGMYSFDEKHDTKGGSWEARELK
jgi:branched-chain amino acid transport system substrate-binding protein